ncbi:MAG: sn-glycerol-3-phosphate ABC transporter ATP-binding protein UgpC [Pelagimonas sp.]|jgi:multiple sugar transport system ATP-binding protein|nr:sn-glycerol-3-phosphate ABC transporter ATP-binding protein UgpC [Pelagimonas sp.]
MGQLELSAVTKSFGTAQVIKPTNLTIDEGDFIVFVGPSGCGKSTILRMIAGLEEITSGTVSIDGVVVNDLAPVKRGISMVFQSYALYPHMNVFENIAFPLRVSRMPQADVEERVNKAAKILKLEERLKHRPGELSGGQRQRVAIGRAIVREPQVFLFDEPLSNLDAALRAEMRVELSRLHTQLGNTMIYVTHDQVEAMTMATKIVVLRDGVIEQTGSPLELFHMPCNKFVAGFIGNPNMNFIDVTCAGVAAEGVTVTLPDGTHVTLPVDGQAEIGAAMTLGIRPDDLSVGAGEATLTMVPEVVERLGNQTVVYGALPGSGEISAVVSGALPIALGQDLPLGFGGAQAHLFDAQGKALPRRIDLSKMHLPDSAA